MKSFSKKFLRISSVLIIVIMFSATGVLAAIAGGWEPVASEEFSVEDVSYKSLALIQQSTSTPAGEPDGGEAVSDDLVIGVAGGGTMTVSSSTYITLRIGWVDATAAEAQEFFDTFQLVAYLDGVALPDSGASYSPIVSCGEGCFRMDYYYDLGTLSPGTYTASIQSSGSGPLFTPGCGEEGCTGPYEFPVTIVVEASEETPTASPTLTSTPTSTNPPATATLTSTPVPFETNTPTPAAIVQAEEPGLFIGPLIHVEEDYLNVKYRDSGPFVPEFTTNIPSPMDVSLEPAVIGTNIFLAAILMIPFAYSNELLGRMLEESKKKHVDRKKSTRRFKRLSGWLEKTISVNTKGRIVFRDRVRVLILILIYGLMFSMLDSTWKPFSIEGVLLFINMALIFGVVGMLDDFIQLRKIRKWNLPVSLKFRPGNLLVAITSILISRFLFLLPGVMFGTPEFLQTNDERISQTKQKQLLKISMITFTIIGLVAWISTIFTRNILQDSLVMPDINVTILGGFEALMLIIFAVIVENYFIQMLGFPGSFGSMFIGLNRKLWFVSLILITFLFLHTLINPQGDLMNALQKGNVIVFIGAISTFIVGVLSTYAFLWIRKRRKRAREAKERY